MTRFNTKITGIEFVDKDGNPLSRPILVTTVISQISKYPGRYSVDEDMIASLKPGDDITIDLERGGPRKGVETPQYESDYYHNVVSVTKGHQSLTNPTPGATPANVPPTDPRQASIERQVAFKGAIDVAVRYVADGDGTSTNLADIAATINELTDRFTAILQSRPTPVVPEHRCLEHMQEFRLFWDREGNDIWVHRLASGGYCQERAAMGDEDSI